MPQASLLNRTRHDPAPSAVASTHPALSALPVLEARVGGMSADGALPWQSA